MVLLVRGSNVASAVPSAHWHLFSSSWKVRTRAALPKRHGCAGQNAKNCHRSPTGAGRCRATRCLWSEIKVVQKRQVSDDWRGGAKTPMNGSERA
jgi:hypothetical protein